MKNKRNYFFREAIYDSILFVSITWDEFTCSYALHPLSGYQTITLRNKCIALKPTHLPVIGNHTWLITKNSFVRWQPCILQRNACDPLERLKILLRVYCLIIVIRRSSSAEPVLTLRKAWSTERYNVLILTQKALHRCCHIRLGIPQKSGRRMKPSERLSMKTTGKKTFQRNNNSNITFSPSHPTAGHFFFFIF